MKRDREFRRIVAAVVGAGITFCVVAVAVYYWIAGVATHGWMQGGPVALTGAMAGLFAGGLAAMVALILLLRRSVVRMDGHEEKDGTHAGQNQKDGP